MKKILSAFMFLFFINSFAMAQVISNEKIDDIKVLNAENIILQLQNETREKTKEGYAPFGAYIFDSNGKLIAKGFDSTNNENSFSHAEINAIKEAEKYYKTNDLSKYNLSIYITSEPCSMCVSAIMFAGIKNVYFGVTSKNLKELIGIDNGIKTKWIKEFKKRGIVVYGGIDEKIGEKVLYEYMGQGYKLKR